MTQLKIGAEIDIQRSNGRVHKALVSGIDVGSVTVEWFEYEETKGKEVSLDQVYALNPDYAPKIGLRKPSKRLQQQQQVPAHPTPVNHEAPEPRSTPATHSRAARARSMAPSLQAPQKYAPAQKINKAELQPKASLPGGLSGSEKENKPTGQTRDRRSHCVKEVERLKKNREARRARQSVLKNEAMQDLEPGNPNIHFLRMIRDFQESMETCDTMSMDDPIVDHQICVCVRKRPLNKTERNKKYIDIITIPDKENVIIHECRQKVDLTKYLENQKFRFDYCFNETSTNDLVYRYTAKPLVETVFQQGMATCFAYGQTGSGKSHTMGGDFHQNRQDCSKGIYALAANDIFKLQHQKYKSQNLVVSCSFFEIYSGKVHDLLNKRKKLRVLEDGKAQVQIPYLQENIVHNVPEVLKLLEQGLKTRTSGVTGANQNSSRSHAIFQIILRKKGRGKDGADGALHGKFSLIDLAGNERGADTISSDRQTRLEGAAINKSLLALKECIRALGRKGAHLPFRASKLTQVLKDSFMGNNAKTCMISMISPGMDCAENSLNTLRYADRVKELGPDGSSKDKEKKIIDYQDDFEDEDEKDFASNSNTSYQNQELAMLCTKSEKNEGNDDLYNFHEAVSLLIETEEQIIDEHRANVEQNYTYLEEEKKMLECFETDVDCDVEEYIRRLDAILKEKIEKSTSLRQKVQQLKDQLNEEEKASKNVRRMPVV